MKTYTLVWVSDDAEFAIEMGHYNSLNEAQAAQPDALSGLAERGGNAESGFWEITVWRGDKIVESYGLENIGGNKKWMSIPVSN
ncbi:hypothetical protein A1359_00935 [Methylomonas lenta]|uniref:Uncharacterized protein n=1 Tax=Methylomonas lenta TaxID=980561 RepID=A0A177N939_9GAMM|nr:hypothetical protein [Methylomonas lenta]OAI14003.1 hypothetical protein A1359_00935 [Methylomonas lenta]